MHRNIIYIEENLIKNNQVIIKGEDVNYLKNVLRKKKKDYITGKTFKGYIYQLKIIEINSKKILTEIITKEKIKTEKNHKIIIALSMPKPDTFKSILKKSIELGVTKIIPLITERSFIKKKEKFNQIRFEKIIKNSLQQSGRNNEFLLSHILNLNEFLTEKYNNYNKIFPYECEEHNNFSNIIIKSKKNNYIFVIGPEGGFSKPEKDLILKNNYISVKLSNSILRVETAVLYCIAGINIYQNFK